MRELAKIAVAQNFSQYSLAAALGEPARNISRYFESKKPRRSTIEKIGRALALDPDYVSLIVSQRLGHDELSDAQGTLFHDLLVAEHAFKPHTRRAVAEFIDGCSDHRKQDALFTYVMVGYRYDAKIGPPILNWPSIVPMAIGAFADSVLPDFDLRSHLRAPSNKHEAAFLELYQWFMSQNESHKTAEQILESLRLSMQLAGISHEQLDEYLHADIAYRTDKSQHEIVMRTRARSKNK